MIVHRSPSYGELQGIYLKKLRALRMADKNRRGKKP